MPDTPDTPRSVTNRDPVVVEELAYLHERIDHLEKETGSRVWFYPPGSFGGMRANVLPWIGSDGNTTWCRRTIVLPLFGLGAVIIGLRWHYATECEVSS